MRSRPSRVLSLLTVGWLWIFLTQPAVLAPCPMHVAGHAHAPMSHMPPGHQGANECSCVHACANGGAVVPMGAEVVVATVSVASIVHARYPEPTWHPRLREYARPPSLAPPAFTA